MISVKKAQQLVLAGVKKGQSGRVGLLEAAGRVLARDIRSPEDLPRFDQSAMDGYAVRAEDLGSPELKIAREIFAGGALAPALKAGECAYITTGSFVPSNAGAVLPVEDVLAERGYIRVRAKAGKGDNIRPAGDDVRKGSLIAGKGTLLTPQAAGVFAALGITRPEVFLPPAVGLLTTGSEVEAMEVRRLAKNKIRNANLCSLMALLRPAGVEPAFAKNLEDRPGCLVKFLGKLKKLPEIVILTGGVSVGGHDHVKQELEEFGVRSLFWKVAQKPGKPMYAGVKGGTLFLGLPGNPAAAIICFYLYALPAINKYMGRDGIFLPAAPALLTAALKAGGSRALFLRGHYKDGKVEPLRGQGSHMLSPFLRTNCLIELKPSGPRAIEKGGRVKVLLLN